MADVLKPSTSSAAAPRKPTSHCKPPILRELISLSVSTALSMVSSFRLRGLRESFALLHALMPVDAAHGHDRDGANEHGDSRRDENGGRGPAQILEQIADRERTQDRA